MIHLEVFEAVLRELLEEMRIEDVHRFLPLHPRFVMPLQERFPVHVPVVYTSSITRWPVKKKLKLRKKTG